MYKRSYHELRHPLEGLEKARSNNFLRKGSLTGLRLEKDSLIFISWSVSPMIFLSPGNSYLSFNWLINNNCAKMPHIPLQNMPKKKQKKRRNLVSYIGEWSRLGRVDSENSCFFLTVYCSQTFAAKGEMTWPQGNSQRKVRLKNGICPQFFKPSGAIYGCSIPHWR